MRHAVRTPEQLARLVPLTDDERARLRGDGGAVPPGHLARTTCRSSIGSTRSARCGCRPSPCAPRRASARASCAIRSARTRTGPVRGHRPQVPGPGAASSRSIRCSVYCRHCTRRRITKGGEAELDARACARGHRVHPRRTPRCATCSSPVGTRSCSSTSGSRSCSAPLRAIPHVEMIRIGTRVPVCLPMRVTDDARAPAAPARAALRRHPLQPPQGDHRPRRARPASGWWTTASRWRTRRC